ncbi:MAG: TonB-dependent receptor [Bacteroidia bacterium]|nr:TonB-dependent receptor [Bacteroidia bacterium]
MGFLQKFRNTGIVLIWLVHAPAGLLWAQTGSYTTGQYTLDQALKHIEQLYKVKINYNATEAQQIQVPPLRRGCPTPEQALDQLLRGTGLAYRRQDDKHILVCPAKETAEPLIITGVVIDANTQEALSMASVRVFHEKQASVQAGSNGFFRVSLYNRQPDTLCISFAGYKPDTQVVSGAESGLTIRAVLIQNDATDSVIITQLTPALRNGQGLNGISVAAPARRSTLMDVSGRDLLRNLTLIPGVSSINESASEMSIRGGSPDQNLVLLDNITLYQPGHANGALSVVNPDMIRGYTLYRSGFDARNGGRLSGLIDMKSCTTRAHPRMVLGSNAVLASAMVSHPIADSSGSFAASFRHSLAGWLYPGDTWIGTFVQQGLVAEQATDSSRGAAPRFTFGDAQFSSMILTGRQALISVSGFVSWDRLLYHPPSQELTAGTEELHDATRQQSYGFSLNWDQQWNQRLAGHTSAAFSGLQSAYQAYYGLSSKHGAYSREQLQNSRVQDLTLRHNLAWWLGRRDTLHLGVHTTQIRTQTDATLVETFQQKTDSIPLTDRLAAQAGLILTGYGDFHWRMTPQIFVRTGVRYSWYQPTQKRYWEPRAEIRVALTDAISLNLSWGIYRQFVVRTQMMNALNMGEDYWMLTGADSFPVSQSRMATMSLVWRSARHGWEANLEVYRKHMDGLVAYSLSYNPFTYQTEENGLQTAGQGTACGAEAWIKKTAHRYSFWASYTLSNVIHQFDGLNAGQAYPALFDQRHQVRLGEEAWLLARDKPNTIKIAAVWLFASGKPYSQPDGIRQESQGVQPLYLLQYTSVNAVRLPAYHRLDISATWVTRPAHRRFYCETTASVWNLYNRQNIESRRYFLSWMPGNEQMPSISSMDRYLMRLTPNISVNLVF